MLLFLNDIAGSEVLLILVFILIFFGSKSIPSIAKTFGKTIYQIKQASNDLQNEIKKSGLDIKKDLNIREKIQEITDEIQIPLDQQMVEMEDIIDYKIPFGALGRLMHPFIVQPKLTEIFNYRTEKLIELFGEYKG